MEIRDCMKRNVFSISMRSTIRQAAALVVDHHIGLLPVMDGQGKPIGVVRLADLLSLELPDFFNLLPDLDFVHDFGALETLRPQDVPEAARLTMRDLMQPPVAVEQTCGLLRAFATMTKHEIRDYFKTTILLIALTLLLVWAGSMVGGRQGATFAFAIAMGMNFFSYWFSDKIVLKMYGARIVSEQESPDYYAMVRELTERAGMPMPKIYIIPTTAMNAFATGRNPSHAAVAVTEGMLNSLKREELKGAGT